MKISTFGFLTRRGVRNLSKHWAMTIACIASLSVCMTLNIFASLIEVNVDSMVSYLGSQNEMVVYVDPEADDATIQSVGNALSGTAGVSRVQYMSKEDVLNQYKGYMSDYAALLNEFENDNPFKANYRVSLSDLSQMEAMSRKFEAIEGVYSVTAVQSLCGAPVFESALTFTYRNSALSRVDGTYYPAGEIVRVSQRACISCADALVALLSSRDSLGWVGSEIVSCEQGYVHSETASSALRFVPVWRIETDAGTFYVNGITREVRQLAS